VGVAVRLSCATVVLAYPLSVSAQATTPGSAELDPTAPLDPMPDIGVEWPDMNAPDATVPSADGVEAKPAPLAIDGAEERRYSVIIEGFQGIEDEPFIAKAFDAQSALREGRGDAANAAQIDRRSRADADLLEELLRSRGYYDADVIPRIEITQQMLQVVLAAEPGRQYRFQSVELPGLEAAGPEAVELRKAFAVQAGDPVVAQNVIDAGTALQVALGEEGFALADVGEQQVEVDHQTHTASLVLPVNPGPVAHFGQITVSGRPPFSAKHLQTIARFDPGDPFKRSKINDLRRALIATGLVASAEVRVVPSPDRQTVNVDVHLEPAPMRTVAGELGYGTGEGIRAEASWQHRNFVNPEGALTLRGVAGTNEQLASAEFRRSNFMRRDQVLDLLALASNVDRDAYRAKTIQLSGLIERQSNIIWRKKWTWSYGADLIATDERGIFEDLGKKETRTFLIAAAPVSLRYDGSNDLLDPTTGFRLGGRISPEISARGGKFTYGRIQIDASAYHPVSDTVVVAGRIRLGTILGARSPEIAPSRRFYSGGGGSVRGFGYQRLGPRDDFGDPIGGRGLAEFALEARIRLKAFGGNFGIVPFVDGGTLTGDVTPDFGQWQFGAGVGVRYYSSFGPIRVDVGTPLNPRTGDAPVAVVVSLGQAF
jgi:translocation and assembly module TamA